MILAWASLFKLNYLNDSLEPLLYRYGIIYLLIYILIVQYMPLNINLRNVYYIPFSRTP